MNKPDNATIAHLILNICQTWIVEEKDQIGTYRDAMGEFYQDFKDIIIDDLSDRGSRPIRDRIKDMLKISYGEDSEEMQDLKRNLSDMNIQDYITTLVETCRKSDLVDVKKEFEAVEPTIKTINFLNYNCPRCQKHGSENIESIDQKQKDCGFINRDCSNCRTHFQIKLPK